jgi:hypothetical protein
MTTEARKDGDEYVIDGKKQWITNGERSGVVILFAKTDRDDPDSVTQFLVPKDTEGLEVGKKEDKLGLRASDTTTLLFDGARIPAENRLTEVGDGLKAAFSILTGGRIAIASQAVGVADAALEAAIEYADEREQFGKPIVEHQAIAHKLADMATNVRAARLLTRDAAEKNDEGVDPMAASMAKYFASETRPRQCRSTAATVTPKTSTSSATIGTRRSQRSTRAPPRSKRRSSPDTSESSHVDSVRLLVGIEPLAGLLAEIARLDFPFEEIRRLVPIAEFLVERLRSV